MRTLALGLDRTRLEIIMFRREKEAVFFLFLFLVLMLGLFSVVFAGNVGGGQGRPGVSAARYFLPGMAAAGLLLSSFQSMAISIAIERDDGTLKRLRGTPIPASAYFLGKIGLVLATSLAQFALLIAVAVGAFGVRLPTDVGHWCTFGWIFLLGVTTGTICGVAYSSLIPTARSATAMVTGPALILQFISGVYFAYSDMPRWVQQVAAIFPLKWIAQGERSVFLPEGMRGQEVGGSWEHTRTALVLGGWAAVGLLIAVLTFRWISRRPA